jgi:hypothetical protein
VPASKFLEYPDKDLPQGSRVLYLERRFIAERAEFVEKNLSQP